MKVAAFDFDLPPEFIAQSPAEPRDAARLLTVGRAGALADRTVADLPDILRPGDLMVVNDTRVLPTRLTGRRGAAKVEVTLHKERPDGSWLAFAKPARKLRPGDVLQIGDDLAAEVMERLADGEVRLDFHRSSLALRDALAAHGRMPLPPYFRRGGAGGDARDQRDRRDYQTIFATHDGAVAAPTAGLHFTDRLLAALDARGVERVAVTLHVGAGTFQPVRVDDTDDHRMHGEHGEVAAAAAARIEGARAEGRRIVAVGTTSLRLLEAAAGEGGGGFGPFRGETDIFITPGYRFRVVDLLLTNFHLPRSTLFMLVSAFAGLARMQAAYAHAKAAGYRFYSYGDACLIERNEPAD